MSTYRKLISDVRSMHRLLSTDNVITDRAIMSELKTEALLLIKRETNLRRLWATDTIFTTIPCMELIEVPVSECCSYVDPCKVARTKLKLPRICEGIYQYIIQGVYSINAMSGSGKKLTEITINRYINLLKLPIVKKEQYYWIANDYLYVSDPFVESVRIAALFEEDIPIEMLYPECCGREAPVEEYCKNPLDRESFVPGYLEQQVLNLTSQRLLATYFGIKEDVRTDNIDTQSANTGSK